MKKISQNPAYTIVETAAAILAVIAVILWARASHTASLILLISAAVLFLISAALNISTVKKQERQMKNADPEEFKDLKK